MSMTAALKAANAASRVSTDALPQKQHDLIPIGPDLTMRDSL